MDKPRFVISSPFDTYSGYGARARDIIAAIIKSDKYEVELVAQRWGDTAWGFCKNNEDWTYLLDYAAKHDWRNSPIDIWMQVTIPNEFQPLGKYNIGVTAGIETTVCRAEWLLGVNRMSQVWVSSEHSKKVFEETVYEERNKDTNQVIGVTSLATDMRVVFEGYNPDVYKNIKKSELELDIKEDFCFLFVGHWLRGDMGHDRKNVGLMIKSFFETFKNREEKPALLLKTSYGVPSTVSREQVLENILKIRKEINSTDLPNVYLLNADMTDHQMNELYQHKKVKAMVSFTKGEGFGRPLLEFSTTGKPIIASNWSGHLDFLHPEYTVLIPGTFENVHPSAANDWLIKESKWFKPDELIIGQSWNTVFKNYKTYKQKAQKQRQHVKKFRSVDMAKLIDTILTDSLPDFPKAVDLNLPTFDVPKLEKIDDNG